MTTRFGSLTVGLACAAFFGLAAPAFADEVTTTTHTETTTPGVVVDTPPTGVVVEHDSPDCKTKKVTKTNEDTGESVSKTKTACDD